MEAYEIEVSAEIHAQITKLADGSGLSVQEVAEQLIQYAIDSGIEPVVSNELPDPEEPEAA